MTVAAFDKALGCQCLCWPEHVLSAHNTAGASLPNILARALQSCLYLNCCNSIRLEVEAKERRSCSTTLGYPLL